MNNLKNSCKTLEEKMASLGIKPMTKTELERQVEKIDQQAKLDLNKKINTCVSDVPKRFKKIKFSEIASKKEQEPFFKFCQTLIESVIKNQEKNGIILGSIGSGKTLFLSGVINEISQLGHTGCLATLSDVMFRIKAAYALNISAVYKEIQYFSTVELLALDEIDIIKANENTYELLNTIINNRYNNELSTVIISNKSLDQVKELLGDRIVDRLRVNGSSLTIKMDSARN
ncbi:MAG: ATP-binding protein [Mesoflavibacter sp.]|nr:ATP-binding protein [Mesoflavibacter sp.]